MPREHYGPASLCTRLQNRKAMQDPHTAKARVGFKEMWPKRLTSRNPSAPGFSGNKKARVIQGQLHIQAEHPALTFYHWLGFNSYSVTALEQTLSFLSVILTWIGSLRKQKDHRWLQKAGRTSEGAQRDRNGSCRLAEHEVFLAPSPYERSVPWTRLNFIPTPLGTTSKQLLQIKLLQNIIVRFLPA